MKTFILISFFGACFFGYGQTLNIPNGGTHNTTVNESYTELTASNNATLHVHPFATLTINGPANLNNGLNIIIDVDGTLIITGCLDGNNNFNITTNGTLQLNCVTLNNNGSFIVTGSGDVDISGDFTTGTSTTIDIQLNGELTVMGNMDVTSGTVNVDGDLIVGGSYSGPAFSGAGTVTESGEVIYSAGVLPITLSYFGGTCGENGNDIIWVTSSESNTSHFILKRSTDGFNWEESGYEKAAGNSSVDIEYNIIDQIGNRNQLTYYELHQFDLNGESNVYGPISVACEIEEVNTIAKLSPNPSVEASYLTVENCPLGDATITLMSSRGELMYTERLSVTQANDSYFIDALDLAKGSYIINFVAPNGELISMKLMKN